MRTITFRGTTYSDQDVLDAMARFDRDRSATFTRWKTYAIKRDGNQYPPKEILRMMVGDIGQLTGGDAGVAGLRGELMCSQPTPKAILSSSN